MANMSVDTTYIVNQFELPHTMNVQVANMPDTMNVHMINIPDTLNVHLVEGSVSLANATYSMDNLVWWILVFAGGLAALMYLLAFFGFIWERVYPNRILKLGTSFLLIVVGGLANSTICWSLIAVLEFALLLKKSTIIDICKALSLDVKDHE